MNVLITGATGFLATYLAQHLPSSFNIKLVGRSKPNNNYSFCTYNELFDSSEKFDIVFHLASYIPAKMNVYEKEVLDANIDLTAKLVDKFRDSFFIFASSVSIYGFNQTIIKEDTESSCQSIYAYSKLIGEHLVKQLPHYRIVRFSSIYGCGMNENTYLPRIINDAIHKQQINVWGDGARLQNYIEVNDAAQYLIKTLDYPSNAIFLGVGQHEISNLELAKLVAFHVDEVFENTKQVQVSLINEDNSPSFQYDNTWTLNSLNWQPEITLTNGIKNIINWKRKQF